MSNAVKINFYANNLGETQQIASELAKIVTKGTIILLDGNLGSGKTTFMQSFGRSLGITTTITSPTFTLIDEYTEGRLPLYHIDLYRLESSQVSSLHLEEYWRGVDFPLGIVAIEWASKLLKSPNEYLKINLLVPNLSSSAPSSQDAQDSQHKLDDDIDYINLEESRRIQLTAIGSSYVEVLQQLQAKIPHLYQR